MLLLRRTRIQVSHCGGFYAGTDCCLQSLRLKFLQSFEVLPTHFSFQGCVIQLTYICHIVHLACFFQLLLRIVSICALNLHGGDNPGVDSEVFLLPLPNVLHLGQAHLRKRTNIIRRNTVNFLR